MHCQHYQEQFWKCCKFLQDSTSTRTLHESVEEQPVKHLKVAVPSSSHPSPSLPDSQALLSVQVQNPTTNIPPEELTSSSTGPVVPLALADYPTPSSSILPCIILHTFNSFHTNFNKFGIAHEYQHWPSYDPKHNVMTEELTNFGNNSVWQIMTWQMTGNHKKSCHEMKQLIDEVLHVDDFRLEDLSGFNAEMAMRKLDKAEAVLESDGFDWDGWKTDVGVDIQVPSCEKCTQGSEWKFTVHGLAFWPLISVIQPAFREAAVKWFHFTLFKHIWKSPVTSQEQCLYNKLYTTDS
ncbi:hypothetical protein V8B97DRAFT_2021303 [Scleroderma yunnanense]